MSRINELRLIARVAQMYFVEQKKQNEIAEHLRLSQATVSRMLKKAQSEGIVRTSIISPAGTYQEFEQKIREKYLLSEVIIVDCSENRKETIMERIGEAAAHFLEATIQDNEIIGVSSWSETILKMVDNIHPMSNNKAKYIVQTLGGIGNPSVQNHATQLITRLAQLTGASSQILYAQGVAQSAEAKSVMLDDPFVQQTMALFSEITLAIIGIGALGPSKLLTKSGNIFTQNELESVSKSGAVGEFSLHFYNQEGDFVSSSLDSRVIGISINELKNVDRVMALAGGKDKVSAIDGALKTGVIDVLVTDKFTAKKLIT